MHGRIVQYSHASGSGIIINNHKKLYNFKLVNWHDKTRIPELDLFVEFKLDDDNTSVIYVKSSKYQEFDSGSIIKERDFWKTVSDDELEKLEQGVFEDLIAQTTKNTDYAIISDIKPSITIENFINYHFELENRIVKLAKKLPTGDYELLDYRVLTRFLMRTLDSLLYAEKRYNKDTFSAYLEIYNKLQYFVTPFYKSTQDSRKIFEDEFLGQQLYFTAARRKLAAIKEDILRVESRLHALKSQILNNEQRLSGAQNKQQTELRAKIERLKEQYKEAGNSRIYLINTRDRIEQLLQNFIERFEGAFIERFEKTRGAVFEDIKVAMNTALTSLDNKMWQLAMDSVPVRNYYFKTNITYSFCILAFVLQYLKTLDASKLSENDKILYAYVQRYRQRNTREILILSNDERIRNHLRVTILTMYKDFLITNVSKKMEYEITIQSKHFDFVIIDDGLENVSAIEMVIFGKTKKINHDSRYVIYKVR